MNWIWISNYLISIVCLNWDGYSCHYENNSFKLFYDFVVAIDTLSDDLYKINLDPNFENSINTIVEKKRKRIDETSSMLWHRRLKIDEISSML